MGKKLKIKEIREIKKKTQSEIAILLDVDQSYISKLENEKESTTIEMLYKIANALEVCPKSLLSKTKHSDCKKCSNKEG